MKKKIILVSGLILVLGLLYWASTVSFVKISVNNQASGQLAYKVYSQTGHKTAQHDSGESQVSQRVNRGTQEVTVTQGDKNYFVTDKTQGFFRTTEVTASLQPEKQRRIVGNDPAECMAMVANTFVSSVCNDRFRNLKIQVPASSTQPTYVVNPTGQSLSDGYIEGFINLKSGTYVLIRWSDEFERPASHELYGLTSNLKSNGYKKILSQLDSQTNYNIKPYKDGFMIYDDALSQVLYLASPGAQPTSLAKFEPDDSSLQAESIDSHQGSFIALFGGSQDSKKSKSEVIIMRSGGVQHYNFDKAYSEVRFCGQQFCLLGDGAVDIYSPDSDNLVSSVHNAVSMSNSSAGFIVVTKDGLLKYDTSNLTGYYMYSFGDYTFNNLSQSGSNFLVSLTGPNKQTIALLINPSANNVGSIDKKILDLYKLPSIQSISANGKFIYVTPDLGELVYNQSTNSYGYDPAKKRSFANSLSAAISRLNIDRNQYTVINTAR